MDGRREATAAPELEPKTLNSAARTATQLLLLLLFSGSCSIQLALLSALLLFQKMFSLPFQMLTAIYSRNIKDVIRLLQPSQKSLLQKMLISKRK